MNKMGDVADDVDDAADADDRHTNCRAVTADVMNPERKHIHPQGHRLAGEVMSDPADHRPRHSSHDIGAAVVAAAHSITENHSVPSQ